MDKAEFYRSLFDSNPLPMWVYDRDTQRFIAVTRLRSINTVIPGRIP